MAVMLSLLLVSLAVGLSAAGGSCEQGWVTYAGRCYQYFPALKTWIDAEVQCLSLGGNLASVHSSDANQFITTLIKSKDPSGPVTWLGGSNCVRDSTWLWTDGSKWDFTNWNAGEPNNVGGVEKCFHINFAVQSGWNDINCVSQYPFVCVKNIK